MGKRHQQKCMEIAMRLARYLRRETVVSGQAVSGPLFRFAVSASETDFEEAIAELYHDRRWDRRRRFLSQHSRILDWLYGPVEDRLYRHGWSYCDMPDRCRKDYREFLDSADFAYEDHDGQEYTRTESHYNEYMLEYLLPEHEWERVQIERHGPDFQPAQGWDRVKYRQAIPAENDPPPKWMEMLLKLGRLDTFERNPVG